MFLQTNTEIVSIDDIIAGPLDLEMLFGRFKQSYDVKSTGKGEKIIKLIVD